MAQVAKIENVRRLNRERRNIYTALEDLDFHWDLKEVWEFDHMWREGLSIWDIARAFGRDPDEVAILAMDRIRVGAIQERPGGAHGRRRPKEKGGDRMIEIWANWLDNPAEFMRQWEAFWTDGE